MNCMVFECQMNANGVFSCVHVCIIPFVICLVIVDLTGQRLMQSWMKSCVLWSQTTLNQRRTAWYQEKRRQGTVLSWVFLPCQCFPPNEHFQMLHPQISLQTFADSCAVYLKKLYWLLVCGWLYLFLFVAVIKFLLFKMFRGSSYQASMGSESEWYKCCWRFVILFKYFVFLVVMNMCHWMYMVVLGRRAFNAMTLLVGRQEGHLAWKITSSSCLNIMPNQHVCNSWISRNYRKYTRM